MTKIPARSQNKLSAVPPLALSFSPFHNTWLRPQLVAEIKFAEWTTAGILRHAEFAALRDDKDPKEVLRE